MGWHGWNSCHHQGPLGLPQKPLAGSLLCPYLLPAPDPLNLAPSGEVKKGTKLLQLDPFQALFPGLGISPVLLLTSPSQQTGSCFTEGLWEVVRNLHSVDSFQSAAILAFHLFPQVIVTPAGMRGNSILAAFLTPPVHWIFELMWRHTSTTPLFSHQWLLTFSILTLDCVTTGYNPESTRPTPVSPREEFAQTLQWN